MEGHAGNFFMNLLGEIANNGSLLDGPPDRRVLRHNIGALQVTCYLLFLIAVLLSFIPLTF